MGDRPSEVRLDPLAYHVHTDAATAVPSQGQTPSILCVVLDASLLREIRMLTTNLT